MHAPLLPGSHLYTLIKNSHRETQSHRRISNPCAELYSPERKSRIEVAVREAVFYGLSWRGARENHDFKLFIYSELI